MCKGPKMVVGEHGVGQVRVRVDSVDMNTNHTCTLEKHTV